MLNGGDGNDWLFGGAGNDLLTGGTGKDRFVFGTEAPFGHDRITGLSPPNRDTIVFDVENPRDVDRTNISFSFDPIERLITLHFGDIGSVTFPDFSFGSLGADGLITLEELNGYTQSLAGYDMVVFL